MAYSDEVKVRAADLYDEAVDGDKSRTYFEVGAGLQDEIGFAPNRPCEKAIGKLIQEGRLKRQASNNNLPIAFSSVFAQPGLPGDGVGG